MVGRIFFNSKIRRASLDFPAPVGPSTTEQLPCPPAEDSSRCTSRTTIAISTPLLNVVNVVAWIPPARKRLQQSFVVILPGKKVTLLTCLKESRC
jgi:hypothetical protein